MRRMFLLIFLAALILSACEFSSVAPKPPVVYPKPGEDTAPVQPKVLYPGPQDGEQISWSNVAAMILNQEVSKVVQSSDFKVVVSLKDGRSLVSYLPAAGLLEQVIQQCGAPCQSIEIVTE